MKKRFAVLFAAACFSFSNGVFNAASAEMQDLFKAKLLDEQDCDGIAIKEDLAQFSIRNSGKIYLKPDFNSETINITQIGWEKCNHDGLNTVIVTADEFSVEPFEGLKLYSYGKSVSPVTHKGKTDYWYHVYIKNFNPDYDFCWIFGADLIEYDYPKSGEYDQKVLDFGVKKGLIKIETYDVSSIPQNMEILNIDEEGESAVYFNDEKLIYVINPAFAELDRKNLYVDSDGFTKLKLKEKTYLVIGGKMINQIFVNFQNDGDNLYSEDDKDTDMRYHSYYFKNISASSSFSEKIKGKFIKYEPENLYRCFEVGCKCHPYWWNYSHIPWVEGAAGNGKGESVTVEFTEDMRGISILNGYTDINNMKLYKENSRVKKLLVEDLLNNISQTVTFEDRVYFNYVKFEKPSSKIRLTIKDVYEGSKYTDTCISAIIPDKDNSSDNSEWVRSNILKIYTKYRKMTFDEVLEIEELRRSY